MDGGYSGPFFGKVPLDLDVFNHDHLAKELPNLVRLKPGLAELFETGGTIDYGDGSAVRHGKLRFDDRCGLVFLSARLDDQRASRFENRDLDLADLRGPDVVFVDEGEDRVDRALHVAA